MAQQNTFRHRTTNPTNLGPELVLFHDKEGALSDLTGAVTISRKSSGVETMLGQITCQFGVGPSAIWSFNSQGGTAQVQISEPSTSDDTILLLRVNRGGSTSLSRVSIGAADSGGAGFRLLRVAN